MRSINSIIADVAAAASADAGGRAPEVHSTLLQCIQELMLAAEMPSETAKRLLYQVSNFYDDTAGSGVDTNLSHPSIFPSV